MREQIEHPDIGWIMRTGYPADMQSEPKIYCEECGKDITNKPQYEDAYHDYLCESCLLYFHIKE